MEVRAILRDMGISPRKVRLVTEAVKGRKVSTALELLRFIPNASARPVLNLIKSAVANAENNYALDANELYIIQIVADEAPPFKRMRIASRRGPARITKRRSHITVVISDEYDLVPRDYKKRHHGR
ncbi:MAG: 50S ribosomal protein L22 [Ktedonobacterales bacterium]|nr:50S ribosomal protein L22 [Ktedonobacterales bacterium]